MHHVYEGHAEGYAIQDVFSRAVMHIAWQSCVVLMAQCSACIAWSLLQLVKHHVPVLRLHDVSYSECVMCNGM